MRYICTTCGSTKSQATADAKSLNLKRDFQKGLYTCCQVVSWADEQWLAWLVAAEEDGKWADDITLPLESEEVKAVDSVPVRRNHGREFWDH